MPWRSPSAPLLMSMRMSSWESWRWANALAFLHLLFAFDFHAVGRGLLCICNGMVHHQSIAPPHHEAKPWNMFLSSQEMFQASLS